MLSPASSRQSVKALGAFYTPATIADLLADWVVRDGTERLLEPSVGEGALVVAAVNRARALRGDNSVVRFLVCDIDPDAIEAVTPSLPPESEVRRVDFLQLDPLRTGLFHGVIANPPFTRNHALPSAWRAALRKRFNVEGAAGLWVHFLIHAKEFLAPGGRIAAVIPASGLFSRYGRQTLERIASEFRHIELHFIANKPLWVNEPEERGAILLADGYREGSSRVPEATRWPAGPDNVPWAKETAGTFDHLVESSVPLETLAALSIGVVTGCNKVFLLDDHERSASGIRLTDVRPVVGRARHLPGLQINTLDLEFLAAAGEKTWLLAPSCIDLRGSGTRNRLAKISKTLRRQTVWFKKRSPWWQVQLGEPCDAVFTYMNDHSPRLILADSGLYCTNTMHRVRFRDGVSHDQQISAVLTTISTFGQLAAERLGRSYGGGVLKLELGEARRMPVLACTANELHESFRRADEAIRIGDRDAARNIADEIVLATRLGKCWADRVRAMKIELEQRRAIRQKGYPSANKNTQKFARSTNQSW